MCSGVAILSFGAPVDRRSAQVGYGSSRTQSFSDFAVESVLGPPACSVDFACRLLQINFSFLKIFSRHFRPSYTPFPSNPTPLPPPTFLQNLERINPRGIIRTTCMDSFRNISKQRCRRLEAEARDQIQSHVHQPWKFQT